MGQSISKAFKISGASSSLDGSKLSKPSKGALRTAATGTFNDELSSKSTVSSQDSPLQQHQRRTPQEPSLEGAVASARAFFDAACATKPSQGVDPVLPGPSRQGISSLALPLQTSCLGRERSPTRPVKLPSARAELSQEPEDLDWNEEEDVEHLTRLYDRRTWNMFVLITEARKHQKPCNGAFREEHHIQLLGGEELQFSEEALLNHQGFASTAEVSLDHDMIFSCDLE